MRTRTDWWMWSTSGLMLPESVDNISGNSHQYCTAASTSHRPGLSLAICPLFNSRLTLLTLYSPCSSSSRSFQNVIASLLNSLCLLNVPRVSLWSLSSLALLSLSRSLDDGSRNRPTDHWANGQMGFGLVCFLSFTQHIGLVIRVH